MLMKRPLLKSKFSLRHYSLSLENVLKTGGILKQRSLSPEMLVASLFPRIIACHFPGAVYVKQELNFRSTVFVGDKVVGEVQAKNIRQIKEFFLVKFVTTCFKDGEIVVIGGEAMAMLPTLSIKQP